MPMLLPNNSHAQTDNNEAGWELPPLQALMDSALVHSPILKGASYEVLMSQYELTDAKKDWMQKINFAADFRYGSQFDYSRLSSSSGGLFPISETTVAPSYGIGVSAYMPVSDIFDHKRKKQKAKLRIEQSESRREEIAKTVKQSVITAYYDVLTAQKTLATSTEISAAAGMLYDQSRLDYAESRTSLSEFTKANEAYLNAQNEVETQKFALFRAVRMLEVIVGIELTK
ncbi:MAG: TolC family protein [Bacteroidales bacterium]|jgi:outer membrane protein TolC|nr:TolC family protein [Bacteroidales bacterium]